MEDDNGDIDVIVLVVLSVILVVVMGFIAIRYDNDNRYQNPNTRISQRKILKNMVRAKYPDVYVSFYKRKTENELMQILNGDIVPDLMNKRSISKSQYLTAIRNFHIFDRSYLNRKTKRQLEQIYRTLRTPMDIDVPDEYMCTISLDIMKDPVTCNNGNNFDRHVIETWLEEHNTHPLTRQPLHKEDLVRNTELRKQINDFVKAYYMSLLP